MKLKKILIIAFCVCSLHAKSQHTAGIKADVNGSFFLTSKSAHLESSQKTGGSAGFFYKYAYLENSTVQIDVMFRYRASKMEYQTTGETTNFNYFGIDLPVYFLKQVDIDDNIFYLGLGPFASYGFRSRFKSDAHNIDPYKEDTAVLQRWDFGVAFLIGYETKCKIQFNFNFHLGLRDVLKEGYENASMISHLISLGVGYRF